MIMNMSSDHFDHLRKSFELLEERSTLSLRRPELAFIAREHKSGKERGLWDWESGNRK